ncbi:MAG: hypothetical protein U0271_14840 [Polyangiaceae bacterium]
MSTFRLAVDKALTGVGPFPRAQAEAILEIAYLTMAVDGELRDEEIDAFSVIAAAMLGGSGKLDDASLRTWLDRFAGNDDRQAISDRLEAAVASLGRDTPARLAAYRAACLMALSDLDAADREFEFDLDLIAALGISQDEADRVVEEVNAAVAPTEN